MSVRGPLTAPLSPASLRGSGAGGLVSHSKIGFFRIFSIKGFFDSLVRWLISHSRGLLKGFELQVLLKKGDPVWLT